MKYKIGVFGSAADVKKESIRKAIELGNVLALEKNVIIINGACAGLPYEVAYQATKKGAEIWGYSQAANLKKQKELVKGESSIYKKLIYIPKDYEFIEDLQVCRKYRNVTSTARCDGGIIISGRWGTMNEFTNLHDMGKVIGVLTETGGIADELPKLCKKITKESKAKIFFSNYPQELVKMVLGEVKKRKK